MKNVQGRAMLQSESMILVLLNSGRIQIVIGQFPPDHKVAKGMVTLWRFVHR